MLIRVTVFLMDFLGWKFVYLHWTSPEVCSFADKSALVQVMNSITKPLSDPIRKQTTDHWWSHIFIIINIFSSPFKFDEFFYLPNSNKVIATRFCKWHDHRTIMAPANICDDLLASNGITAMQNFNQIRNGNQNCRSVTPICSTRGRWVKNFQCWARIVEVNLWCSYWCPGSIHEQVITWYILTHIQAQTKWQPFADNNLKHIFLNENIQSWLQFHWILFFMVQFTISQHCFR